MLQKLTALLKSLKNNDLFQCINSGRNTQSMKVLTKKKRKSFSLAHGNLHQARKLQNQRLRKLLQRKLLEENLQWKLNQSKSQLKENPEKVLIKMLQALQSPKANGVASQRISFKRFKKSRTNRKFNISKSKKLKPKTKMNLNNSFPCFPRMKNTLLSRIGINTRSLSLYKLKNTTKQ